MTWTDMKMRVLLLVGGLLLSSGCSNSDSSPEAGQPLDRAELAGPVWELTRYTGPDGLLRDVLPVTHVPVPPRPGFLWCE